MDEQDRRNKYPSLPANYVTLVDLQERRLKEKEQKKEEEEAKQLEQKENQQKHKPMREWRRHNRNNFRNRDAKIAASHVPVNRLPARSNSRRQSETDHRTIKSSELKPDDSNAVVNNGEGKVDGYANFRNVQTNRRCQSEKFNPPIESSELKSEESALENAVVVNEQKANLPTFRSDCQSQSKKGDRLITESSDLINEEPATQDTLVNVQQKRTKKKKRNWRNKKQSAKAEENLAGGTVQVSPENEPAEEIPVVSIDSSVQKDEIRSKFRRNEFNQGKHGKIWEPKVLVDETREIGRKIEGLSLERVKESNVKWVAEKNRGYLKYKKDFGRFNGRKLWKTRPARDANLAWVKKGEISGNNVDDFGSSGSMTNAGEGNKKESGQF